MASFPLFEEYVGTLVSDDLSLETVFQNIVGPKRKYITFHRLIKVYLDIKKEIYQNLLKNFFIIITCNPS